ncbi:hypothetical protein TIFTF001_012147 [Ficus carica]|uniref:Uncharacterized protein n=1 Tax=Ficus carica TaxID=3494 RepID=A0AA88D1F9_FICCA|nr:hypothetical protein TIFTF001_012147 [Ficus carica]
MLDARDHPCLLCHLAPTFANESEHPSPLTQPRFEFATPNPRKSRSSSWPHNPPPPPPPHGILGSSTFALLANQNLGCVEGGGAFAFIGEGGDQATEKTRVVSNIRRRICLGGKEGMGGLERETIPRSLASDLVGRGEGGGGRERRLAFDASIGLVGGAGGEGRRSCNKAGGFIPLCKEESGAVIALWSSFLEKESEETERLRV